MRAFEIIVRSATCEDAAIIAQVIAMAIGDEEGVRHYCGDDYIDVLTKICSRDNTQYSWRSSLVAEVDGHTVGAIVGYDGAELHSLRNGTFEVLRETIGRVPNIVDETEAGEYYLDSIGVLPEYRGKGVGRALIKAFCHMAYAKGHQRVGLIVDRENPMAERLYTSLGFERVGTRLFFGHHMWHLQRLRSEYAIKPIKERTTQLVEQLTKVWEASVRATHHFLSEEDICDIREYVPMAITHVKDLVVAEDDNHMPVAFIGIEDGRIEMLFVAPIHRGCGIGKMLINYTIGTLSAKEVTVNEQNPKAVGFYEHMGFRAYRRSESDEQGRPFPLIYMRLAR